MPYGSLYFCLFVKFLSHLFGGGGGGGGLLGQESELVPPAYARPQNLCFSQPIPPSANNTALRCTALSCLLLHCLDLNYRATCYPLPGCITLSSAPGEDFDGIVGREREPGVVGGRHVAPGAAPPHDNFRPIVSNFKFPPV